MKTCCGSSISSPHSHARSGAFWMRCRYFRKLPCPVRAMPSMKQGGSLCTRATGNSRFVHSPLVHSDHSAFHWRTASSSSQCRASGQLRRAVRGRVSKVSPSSVVFFFMAYPSARMVSAYLRGGQPLITVAGRYDTVRYRRL